MKRGEYYVHVVIAVDPSGFGGEWSSWGSFNNYVDKMRWVGGP